MHHALSPTGIADWLATWGYLGIFLLVFVGNFGIPLPEETVLLAAGFLAGRGILDLHVLYPVGIASAVAGDCAGYLFGRTGGQRLIEWLGCRLPFIRPSRDRLQLFFKTHGNKAVFMARFITGARFMAGPMAGAAGMPFLRFLGWNILGAMVWCSLVITIGYLLGDELEWVVQVVHRIGHWVALAVVLVLGASWLWWWRAREQSGPES
jgi:membrane protein DedA with SNARE-associated domain